MRNIRWSPRFRICRAALLVLGLPAGLHGQATATVTGRVTMQEKDNRASDDIGQAVVWLVGSTSPVGVPDTLEMATEGKQFVPHLLVVSRGSLVSFPNHDPFNHNVFSLSKESPFDLGLYGRGEAKSIRFDRTGVIRVYCNVHAQMRGLVLVEETSLVAQPGADGVFRLEGVPVGEYKLHAWHERAPEVVRSITVAEGSAPLTIALDARGYRFVQHKDKNGKSYADRSRRY